MARITLRLNPRENRFKAQDDEFLQSLLDLLDPGALPASISGPENVWQTLADRSVALGRELLKREWQVVKAPPHTQLFLWLRGR